MIEAIDYEKIFALGIKLDETERPVKIYVPPELSKMIKSQEQVKIIISEN